MKRITAVIPIRVGSQRVKDKNLRNFANTTLMENKIEMLLNVPELDSIIVNTDSEKAIEIVKNKYCNTKVTYHKREEYYASSQCSGSEFFQHLGQVTDTDIFVYAPCTSPFIKPDTISKCIKAFLNNESNIDCIATVSSIKEFMWLDGRPINYDPLNAPNSQNLPNILALNFGATVTSRENLIKNRNIIGKHPQFIVTSDIEAIDIDTPLDFYVAEQIYNKLILEKKDLLD
ncbi:3-deoxy-manno-octulosonate cytidylyltransferase [uncultured Bacteroides sp.]|uniref:acylneuraminate cytidylyltransferase family protein n=1 Tax=Bacteroides cellulolyticus TaxID=2981780 RepID=UPI000820763E|nr:cytidylyltransferase [Bacteroides cellulolyticus]MCU6770346.1 cytidylyltransferase [Bacteroides cellulolyticus]SCH06377.1 3-deoxy-manno-octulosonate cytidylyltransferase [uncultured Bacteroides sp.]